MTVLQTHRGLAAVRPLAPVFMPMVRPFVASRPASPMPSLRFALGERQVLTRNFGSHPIYKVVSKAFAPTDARPNAKDTCDLEITGYQL